MNAAKAESRRNPLFLPPEFNRLQTFAPETPGPRVLLSNQEVSPTAIPSTVFFLARKRCTYGGTELFVGPSTPLRLAEQCYGVGKEISGSNP